MAYNKFVIFISICCILTDTYVESSDDKLVYRVFRKDAEFSKDTIFFDTPDLSKDVNGLEFCARFNACYHQLKYCYCYPKETRCPEAGHVTHQPAPNFYSVNGEKPICHSGAGENLGCSLSKNVPLMTYESTSLATVEMKNPDYCSSIETMNETRVEEWDGNSWSTSSDFTNVFSIQHNKSRVKIKWMPQLFEKEFPPFKQRLAILKINVKCCNTMNCRDIQADCFLLKVRQTKYNPEPYTWINPIMLQTSTISSELKPTSSLRQQTTKTIKKHHSDTSRLISTSITPSSTIRAKTTDTINLQILSTLNRASATTKIIQTPSKIMVNIPTTSSVNQRPRSTHPAILPSLKLETLAVSHWSTPNIETARTVKIKPSSTIQDVNPSTTTSIRLTVTSKSTPNDTMVIQNKDEQSNNWLNITIIAIVVACAFLILFVVMIVCLWKRIQGKIQTDGTTKNIQHIVVVHETRSTAENSNNTNQQQHTIHEEMFYGEENDYPEDEFDEDEVDENRVDRYNNTYRNITNLLDQNTIESGGEVNIQQDFVGVGFHNDGFYNENDEDGYLSANDVAMNDLAAMNGYDTSAYQYVTVIE